MFLIECAWRVASLALIDHAIVTVSLDVAYLHRAVLVQATAFCGPMCRSFALLGYLGHGTSATLPRF